MAGAGKRARKAPDAEPPLVAADAEPADPAAKHPKKVLLDPVYVPVQPTTAIAVENALNAQLRLQLCMASLSKTKPLHKKGKRSYLSSFAAVCASMVQVHGPGGQSSTRALLW